MSEAKNCDLCRHKHNCSEVYEHLGKAEGPGVGFKVFVALFMPIVVFIVSLTVFGKLAAEISASEKLETAIIFLLSLTATALIMLVIKLIRHFRIFKHGC